MRLNDDLKLIISIINGYEEGILQILEKYKVCDRDVEKIQDYIAKIEIYTNKLAKETIGYENYNTQIDTKKAKDRNYQRKKIEKIRIRIFEVYKDDKLIMSGRLQELHVRFGFDKGQLSKIKDSANIKGYFVKVKEERD